MKKSICIVVDKLEGAFDKNVYNTISYISSQFQKEYIIVTACIGGCSGPEIEEFKERGISRLIILETQKYFVHKAQAKYIVDSIEDVIRNFEFSLVIFMATSYGRMLAARLAIRFSCGLVAECIGIDKGEGNSFIFQRAALSGTVIAEIVCKDSEIQMCTIKNISGVFIPIQKTEEFMVEIFKLFLSEEANQVVDEVKALAVETENNFANADIIIGLGSGIKKKELIERIKYIAARLGASVGYTRGFVELNEANRCKQIGQSGILVSPKLYIAFGISGATQHIVGVNNAQCIISINIDENAPMHLYSDYIIVEDAERVINLMYDVVQDK